MAASLQCSLKLLLRSSSLCGGGVLTKQTEARKAAVRLFKVSMYNKYSSSSSGKVRVNGVDLHYEKSGKSPQVVLCLPGALGSTQSDFGPQLKSLCKDFTVVAFDPRGYGKSVPPKRDFPVNFFQRDASDGAAVMATLGYSTYSLLGWSDGGITAMILAAEHPACVDRLVVWGSNAFVAEKDLELYEAVRDTAKWNPKMKGPLEELYGKEGLQEMWSGWIDALTQIHNEKNGDVCKSSVPRIKCPTLIVHGQKDPMVPDIHPEFLHKNIAGSKLHLMPEGRHNLHLRYADEFNDLVTKFLKE